MSSLRGVWLNWTMGALAAGIAAIITLGLPRTQYQGSLWWHWLSFLVVSVLNFLTDL